MQRGVAALPEGLFIRSCGGCVRFGARAGSRVLPRGCRAASRRDAALGGAARLGIRRARLRHGSLDRPRVRATSPSLRRRRRRVAGRRACRRSTRRNPSSAARLKSATSSARAFSQPDSSGTWSGSVSCSSAGTRPTGSGSDRRSCGCRRRETSARRCAMPSERRTMRLESRPSALRLRPWPGGTTRSELRLRPT